LFGTAKHLKAWSHSKTLDCLIDLLGAIYADWWLLGEKWHEGAVRVMYLYLRLLAMSRTRQSKHASRDLAQRGFRKDAIVSQSRRVGFDLQLW